MFFTGRKLTILAHGDSDGVVSAALVKAALRKEYDEIRVFFTHPVGLPSDFKEFAEGDVVIVDIAVSEPHSEELAALFRRYGGSITYIDHHPPPLNIPLGEFGVEFVRPSRDEEASSSELTFKHFRDKLPEDYDRVALYGCIGDYADQTEWVRKALLRWDKRQVYFEAGVLVQGLEGSRRMHDFKRHVVEHLSKNLRPSMLSELLVRALIEAVNNEELYRWVKTHVKVEGLVAYVIGPPGSVGIAATYARGLTGSLVGVAAEERGDHYVLSLRAEKGVIDLDRALRELTHYIGGSGGGHSEAAGARIPKESFKKLIEELNARLRGNSRETYP
ncbi:MAG: DHH family phosphoesterase [Desulfurococcales archaeon]|nr:DHH family phosphoesterase [Desulfurococcales archaeon]